MPALVLVRRRVLLALASACTAGLLLVSPEAPADVTLPILLAAFASLTAFVVLEHRSPATSARTVVGLCMALTVLAVIRPLHGSHDVWSYAMYGRITAVHRANPYVHAPSAFVHDPFFTHVAPRWRGALSVYGGGFTMVSALIAFVAGPSALVARVLFQALAAGAFLAVTAILVKQRTPVPILAAVVLNPLLIVTVVNGGHNDALVGLGIVVAAIAAERERPALAGLLLGLAASVKVVALLPAAALAVWWWRRHRSRASLTMVGVAVVLPVLSAIPFGAIAPWRPLQAASRHVNGPSLWRLVPSISDPSGGNVLQGFFGVLSAVVVLGLLSVTCVIAVRHPRPQVVMALMLTAYLLTTAYVMPWYLAWALPVAAVAGGRKLLGLLALDAAVLLVAAQRQYIPHPDILDRNLTRFALAAELFAVVATAILVAGLVRAVAARRRSGPAPGEVDASRLDAWTI